MDLPIELFTKDCKGKKILHPCLVKQCMCVWIYKFSFCLSGASVLLCVVYTVCVRYVANGLACVLHKVS